ncbi:uncharacterized protein [Lolium perenne]|uniref:uncharacterized protein n=1 Tax=Lolium perenne TaxID=4522 RepID=UPI0021F57B3B|nr:uncharacterized protein LOC127338459 [Lolium perenne]
MRIKTGMDVEAWIKDAATNKSAWRAGKVIQGNGHTYTIKWFDGGPDTAGIKRKFVRPSPKPDVQLPKDLAAGDIVELFDSNMWKWVEVVRVGDRQLDVKFVDSTNVFTADRSLLRPRLLYGEEGWALTHKDDQIPIESAVPSRPIAGKSIKRKATGPGIVNGAFKRSNCTVDSNIVRDVKRFQGDANKLFPKREAPAGRYNNNIEVMDVHPSHCIKKREETGYNADIFLARRTDCDKDNGVRKSDTSSSTSDSSSSCSSGSNNRGDDCADYATVEHCQEGQEPDIMLLPRCNEEEQGSDNRRLQHYQANEVQGVMKQEEQNDRVHARELEAYLSVMKAFHATGSLTWAKTGLLSDLRLQLHVSSDEHLQIIWSLNGKKKPADGPRNGSSVCQ